MKVNINSWHYRVRKEMGIGSGQKSVSLCVYFWQVVIACFLYLGAVSVTLLVAPWLLPFGAKPKFDLFWNWDSYRGYQPFKDQTVFVLYPGHVIYPALLVTLWATDYVSYLIHLPAGTSISIIDAFGVTFLFFLTLITILLAIHVGKGLLDFVEGKLYDRFRKASSADTVKKEPGLLTSYLKAKKENFCPLIEFVAIENTNEENNV